MSEKITMKMARARVNMSTKTIAEKLGVTPSGYHNYEEKRRVPRIDLCIKFCDLTGYTLNDIEWY